MCIVFYQNCPLKNGVVKISANITGKHLCWSLFNKVTGPEACNFIKKETPNTCFEEHLRTTASMCNEILEKIGPVFHI